MISVEAVLNVLFCNSQQHFPLVVRGIVADTGSVDSIVYGTMNLDEESHLKVFGRKEVPLISPKDDKLMALLA